MKPATLIVASLLTGTHTFSQTTIPELVFKNATILSGTAGNDGTVYKFASVATGIDAQVKINGRSSSNVVLSNIDINSTGYDNAFQPLVNYINGDNLSANAVTDWYMEFQVSFVQSASASPTTVSGFNVTALDNDGSASLHEYVSFYGLNTYTLENPTDISVSNILSGLLTIIGKRFDGSTTEYSGIDVTATKAMVSNHYITTSSFNVRVGGKAKGPISIGNNGRQYSLWFKSFSYNNPVINTLPVSLLSFNAQLNNNSKVTLDWATTEEINASHFVVQRSTDGSDFDDAAVIFTEEGNSSVKRAYNYADNISSVNSTLVYYRLKIVDMDGRFRYSDIALIRLGKQVAQAVLLTYPNPAVDQVHVTIPNDWQNKKVAYSIYNVTGSLVQQKSESNAGQTKTFDIANLPLGMYIIKAINGTEISTQKFIKIL